MDEYYNAKRLALILAVQAEIEGMKIENLIRIRENQPVLYNEVSFQEKAMDLRNIAYAHNEQL